MVDDLEFLGTYKDKLKGTTYQEKLGTLFWNIKAIYNLGLGVPIEDREQCTVVLIAAGTILEEGNLELAEAKKRFDVIRKRTWKGIRLEKLIA